ADSATVGRLAVHPLSHPGNRQTVGSKERKPCLAGISERTWIEREAKLSVERAINLLGRAPGLNCRREQGAQMLRGAHLAGRPLSLSGHGHTPGQTRGASGREADPASRANRGWRGRSPSLPLDALVSRAKGAPPVAEGRAGPR